MATTMFHWRQKHVWSNRVLFGPLEGIPVKSIRIVHEKRSEETIELYTYRLHLIGCSHAVRSITQIWGWNEPTETDSSFARYMLLRCMNPSPIFHRWSVDASIVCELCGSVLSDTRVRFHHDPTYPHRV